MLAGGVGAGSPTDVDGGRGHRQARVAQLIRDVYIEGERVAVEGVQPRPHDDAIGRTLHRPPGTPAQEAMDRVVLRRLGQRHLGVDTLEAIAAVRKTVGPGDQRSTVSAVADLVEGIWIEHRSARDRVLANPTTDLDDARPLLAVHDLELLARRRDRWRDFQGW